LEEGLEGGFVEEADVFEPEEDGEVGDGEAERGASTSARRSRVERISMISQQSCWRPPKARRHWAVTEGFFSRMGAGGVEDAEDDHAAGVGAHEAGEVFEFGVVGGVGGGDQEGQWNRRGGGRRRAGGDRGWPRAVRAL
jgi:hypothetical protein